MNKTNKITFCAVMAALASVTMLISHTMYLTYAVPAMAGLFVMIAVIEITPKWAFATYVASAFPIFLLAENESKMLYIMFFGYYPIIKSFVEKLRKPVLEWILKFLVFNIAVIVTYLLLTVVFDMSLDDFGEFGKYGAWIFLALGNVVFVFYDIAVSRMSMFYFDIIRPKFKFFRK